MKSRALKWELRSKRLLHCSAPLAATMNAPPSTCEAPLWARHGAVEPFVATAAFALWINLFRVLESRGDARRALRAVFDVRKSTRVLRAGACYAVGVAAFRRVAPPAAVDWRCPTIAAFLAEVVYGVVLYDLIFFALHKLMHESRVGRLARHGRHHAAARVTAAGVLDHSLADGALQVLANILAQRRGPLGAPKNFLARLAHNVVVTYLLTDSHADTPYRLSRAFPRLLRGARDHRAHHGHGGPPYQQFFGHLDALFSERKVG